MNGRVTLIIITVLFIALIIFGILFLLFYHSTAPSNSTGTNSFSFQPLNHGTPATIPGQQIQYASNIPYAEPATTSQQTYEKPTTYEQPVIYSRPAQFTSPFIQSTSVTPNVVSQQTYAPTQTSESPTETSAPAYNYNITPLATPTYTESSVTNSSSTSGGLTNQDLKNLDEQIFGYASGLGWTQLLGSYGQQVFDYIYGTTPQGTTFSTLGSLIGPSILGGGGGGGGGGFGGGGGGGSASQNFGTLTISNITECTCSASVLLDMQDVRGQTLSLLVTPVTQVKATAMSEYGIHTGMKALGLYTSGGSCMVYKGEECDSQGNPQGSVTIMGTSD